MLARKSNLTLKMWEKGVGKYRPYYMSGTNTEAHTPANIIFHKCLMSLYLCACLVGEINLFLTCPDLPTAAEPA